MRILFDLAHPAHFHLFKHSILSLREAGHETLLVARQKDCLQQLLDEAGWTYHIVPRTGTGFLDMSAETLKALALITSLALKRRIDLMLGTSVVIGPAARFTGSCAIVFNEDDFAVAPIFTRFAYSLADWVVTPRSLAHEAHGRKHLTYPGYHELAYLHPKRFQPDPAVRDVLGLRPDEKYFLVRLVALTAHHDRGERGLSPAQARSVIRLLEKHGRVFISAEAAVDEDLRRYLLPTSPARMPDVLAFAQLFVGDSQTMPAEAAVLGTPALRCSTFVGRLSYLEELEHRYGLTKGFRPEEFDRLLEQINVWMSQPDLKARWQQRRQLLLAECVDLTEWTLDLIHRTLRTRRHGNRPRAAPSPERGQATIAPDQDQDTKRYFDRIALAREADSWARNVDKWDIVEPLLEAVPPGAGVIECGAGTGMYTIHMLQRGLRVTAVDLSEQALQVTRKIAAARGVDNNLRTIPGPFEEVARQADPSFDVAAYFKTLHHLPSLAAVREALAAGFGALKPGGLLVGLEPNGACPLWRPGLLLEGRHPSGKCSVWEMERGLLRITERNLARLFRSLPGARWEIRPQYLVPAFLGRRIPRLAERLNRFLARTPLTRYAFNLTFRVWKEAPGGCYQPSPDGSAT